MNEENPNKKPITGWIALIIGLASLGYGLYRIFLA